MNVQLSHHTDAFRHYEADDLLFKNCDEVLTFDEVFDTYSLRKFFQEHESTNSQSGYSPRKESSIFEEAISLNLDDHDFSLASPQECTSKMDETPSTHGSHINSNTIPQVSEVKQAAQSLTPQTNNSDGFQSEVHSLAASETKPRKNIQIVIEGRNLTMTTQDETPKASTQLDDFIDYASFPPFEEFLDFDDQSSKFEKLLKSKKIFKIERDVKPLTLQKKKRTSNTQKNTKVPLVIKSRKNSCSLPQGYAEKPLFDMKVARRFSGAFSDNSLGELKTLDENNNFVPLFIPSFKY